MRQRAKQSFLRDVKISDGDRRRLTAGRPA